MNIGLALGGGAPNLTLMTGALLALDEAGVDFKVITTTGAGMVVGLLYAAPRREHPDDDWVTARRKALAATREMGIDDLIYKQFPVNYKIFQKPGAMAEAFSHAVNPTIWSIPRKTRRQRLLGDALGFMAAAMSPSSMKAPSQGLCQPPPWIELIVNFDELTKNLEPGDKKFRMSAYCIEDQDQVTFNKEEITAEHFKAALAMPLIYAPYKLKDKDGTWKTYLEGSAFKTVEENPEHVMCEQGIETIVSFDLMSNENMIAEPRGLIDAWGKSIVTPLNSISNLSEDNLKLRREAVSMNAQIAELERKLAKAEGRAPTAGTSDKLGETGGEAWKPKGKHDHHETFNNANLLPIKFKGCIPEEFRSEILDWSHSNMSRLFDIGYDVGRDFAADPENHRMLGLTV